MFCFMCVFLFLIYIFLRLSRGITRSASCLIGKTAIVTGANSGIGYQTTLNLASRGCRVIMADVADMEESRRNVIKYTNNKNVVTKSLDLSSLQSVRDFACDILKNEDRLDILINNAGIFDSDMKHSSDGLNPVMQVNYFGHFLLTHLLTDLLKKSSPSRIVFTTSLGALFHRLTSKNLNCDVTSSSYAKCELYCNSKFAIIVASDIFAEKLKDAGITSNSVHPGVVNSALKKNMQSSLGMSIFCFIVTLIYSFGSKDTWEGSQSLVHVAVSRKLEKVSAKHFWDCRPFFKPRKACDKEFCRKIWEASETLVGLKPEEKI